VALLNLGILAHVDAGKTSLTERLLHDAGVIDEVGSVDDGNTQTDSLELERRRGITIKSAVVSFAIGGTTVNLIDTPGHPDFIAEVERVLGVLDGAVLVISAVEGVQAQTRVIMRTLQRLRIPTILFVNKIDRVGARQDDLLREIGRRLGAALVPMGTAEGRGAKSARFVPRGIGADVLADHDDALLADVVDGGPVGQARLRKALAAQTVRAEVHPVYFGSAITGAGVAELSAGLSELLPAAAPDGDGPLSGTVFKVERGPAGEKIAYVRLFSGTLRVREKVGGEKVTSIAVFADGGTRRAGEAGAGRIAKLWGLSGVRIGDPVGAPGPVAQPQFAPPSLETVVVPARPGERGAVHAALAQLAEQDPLIDLRQDDVRGEVFVSLYGEVQKEVVQATLAGQYGLAVTFRQTTTVCIERPAGTGEAAEVIKGPGNPFLATVGLRVEPGTGFTFRLGVELGAMPLAFFRAVEETVRETLRQGLYGWQVTDVAVTMTRSGYCPRQSHAHGTFDKSMSSTAGDFRQLTPLVLMAALSRAGTVVSEPIHRFTLDAPADTLPAVLTMLGSVRAVPLATGPHRIEGDIPAARVHDLQQALPALTRGEGVLESTFGTYERVQGPPPSRSRTDQDPLDRKEYLLRVVRRTSSPLPATRESR
jgi:ribosomal protection tetracycline resistance protein